jgi:hypothetical protein
MLVVESVSINEEEREVKCIAEIFLIGERIRSLARQQNNNKNKKKRGRRSSLSFYDSRLKILLPR